MTNLCGCRREDRIETYRVSKESESTSPATATAQKSKEITWTVPSGWKEQPPSAMRLGSFLITGADGRTADVSIIPLSGLAGGNLANINRWRGQIQLSPLTEDELAKNSEWIHPADRPMLRVNFAHDQRRLIAAIYTHGGQTWFFKMMGDDSTVENAHPDFLHFLENLRFHESAQN